MVRYPIGGFTVRSAAFAQAYENDVDIWPWVTSHGHLITVAGLGLLFCMLVAVFVMLVFGDLRRDGWRQWRDDGGLSMLLIPLVVLTPIAAVMVFLIIGPGSSLPFWSR